MKQSNINQVVGELKPHFRLEKLSCFLIFGVVVFLGYIEACCYNNLEGRLSKCQLHNFLNPRRQVAKPLIGQLVIKQLWLPSKHQI